MIKVEIPSESRFELVHEVSRWHHLIAQDTAGNVIEVSPWFDPVHVHGLPLNQVYIEPMREFVMKGKELPVNYVQMGPTNVCNLGCVGCFSSSKRGSDTMQWEYVEQAIKNLPSIARLKETGTAMIAWHGPGDPCVSQETRNIVAKGLALSSEFGIANRIVSNGTFDDDDFIKNIVKNPMLKLIWISLKTGDPVSYKNYTRREYQSQVIKVMETIANARSQYGREQDLVLKVSTEISMYDPLGFVKAAELAREIGFDIFKPALHYPGFGEAFQNYEHEILEGRAYLASMLSKRFLPLYWELPEKFVTGYKSDKRPSQTCFQVMTRAYFDGKGNMSPCIHWLDNSDVGRTLGNIKEESFLDVWNGELREKFGTDYAMRNSEYCHHCQDPRPNAFHQWIHDVLVKHPDAVFTKKFDV